MRQPAPDLFAAKWLVREVAYLTGRLHSTEPMGWALRLQFAEALVAAVTPYLDDNALVPLLYKALSDIMYPGGSADAGDAAGAVLRLLADTHSAVWAAVTVQCSPPPLEVCVCACLPHESRGALGQRVCHRTVSVPPSGSVAAGARRAHATLSAWGGGGGRRLSWLPKGQQVVGKAVGMQRLAMTQLVGR